MHRDPWLGPACRAQHTHGSCPSKPPWVLVVFLQENSKWVTTDAGPGPRTQDPVGRTPCPAPGDRGQTSIRISRVLPSPLPGQPKSVFFHFDGLYHPRQGGGPTSWQLRVLEWGELPHCAASRLAWPGPSPPIPSPCCLQPCWACWTQIRQLITLGDRHRAGGLACAYLSSHRLGGRKGQRAGGAGVRAAPCWPAAYRQPSGRPRPRSRLASPCSHV